MSAQERFVVVTDRQGPGSWTEIAREVASTGFVESNFQRVAAGTGQRVFGPVSFNRAFRGSGICPGLPLDLMIRCFQEEEDVPVAELEKLLSTRTLAFMEEIRLLVRSGNTFRASVSLTPRAGLLIAADPPSRMGESDYVAPPKDPATTLVDSYIKPLPRRAKVLDLGTGSGLLAVRLQLQGAEATGVDPNPVALRYLTLNSLLNGASPICEGVVGDHGILAKTTGWDQIIFNMPATYATSRRPAYGFAEPGRGLEILRDFYRAMPTALTPCGFAGIRHDMKVSCLSSPDAFLEEIQCPDGLQIVYSHEEEAVHQRRCAKPPNPDKDFPRASTDWVLGGAVVRRLPYPGRSRVDFLSFNGEEIRNYTSRRFWRRLLALDSWKDALMAA